MALEIRDDLVVALEPGMQVPRKCLSEPSDDWSSPLPRGGPKSPKCGCTLCKLKLEQAVSGATQIACRLLDVDNAELAWIIRAYRGSDEVRDPH